MRTAIPLGELAPGQAGELTPERAGAPPVSARLRDLGFVAGTRVVMVRRGPLGGPVELELRGYRICLRPGDLVGLAIWPGDTP